MQQKQGIQLCYGSCCDTRQHFTIPIFWDFNKCLRAVFSQLSFGYFWLYPLGEVVMTQNY